MARHLRNEMCNRGAGWKLFRLAAAADYESDGTESRAQDHMKKMVETFK